MKSQSQSSESSDRVTGVTTDRCISRRGLMRTTAAGIGAATVGGISIRESSQNVKAQTSLEWGIGALGGAAGLYYVMRNDGIPFLGNNTPKDGYTGSDALHQEVFTGVTEMKLADEKVMTSITNNTTNAETVGLTKGKAAIIEAMNAGKTETQAQTALDNALDDYFSIIEKNIINHAADQLDQLWHLLTSVESHSTLNMSSVFYYINPESGNKIDLTDTERQPVFDYTVRNGDTVSVPHVVAGYYGAADNTIYVDPLNIFDESQTTADHGFDQYSPGQIYAKPFDTGSDTKIVEGSDFLNAISDLDTAYNNANQTLTGFVTDVYAEYGAGDIPTEDLVDPITASTELSQNYSGYQGQGAHAAMAGIPTTAEQSVAITIHGDTDTKLLVDIYTEYVPTDGSGTEIGFESGTQYDPSGWSKPLYIAYEFTDSDGNKSTDFVQLEDPFTINEITDKNGETVESFQTTSQNIQTADVAKLQEELDQLRKEQIRLQEEAQEDTTTAGGGGGFLSSIEGTNSKILLIAAAGLGAIGLLGR